MAPPDGKDEDPFQEHLVNEQGTTPATSMCETARSNKVTNWGEHVDAHIFASRCGPREVHLSISECLQREHTMHFKFTGSLT